jgi:hypothetical protein
MDSIDYNINFELDLYRAMMKCPCKPNRNARFVEPVTKLDYNYKYNSKNSYCELYKDILCTKVEKQKKCEKDSRYYNIYKNTSYYEARLINEIYRTKTAYAVEIEENMKAL